MSVFKYKIELESGGNLLAADGSSYVLLEADYISQAVLDSTHEHTSELVGWTAVREARSERYTTTFALDENPIQEGVWPNNAWDNDFADASWKHLTTLDGVAYASGAMTHVARCAYVSGAARESQHSKATVRASSVSPLDAFIVGVRYNGLTGYQAYVRSTGSTLIQYVSGNDTDLIGNAVDIGTAVTNDTQLELRAVNSDLFFVVDGSTIAVRTNSACVSGVPYFGIYSDQGYSRSRLAVTDWNGGTYNANIGINDSTHALKSQGLRLSQKEEDSDVLSSKHLHKSDSAGLIVRSHLDTLDSTHAHTSEQVNTQRRLSLAVEDSTTAHKTDGLTLSQLHNVLVEDSTHSFVSDSIHLVTIDGTSVHSSDHRHTTEKNLLLQEHALINLNTTHVLKSDQAQVDIAHWPELDAKESKHAHTADELTLKRIHVLGVKDSQHAHTSDTVSLERKVLLAAEDSAHQFVSDFAGLVEKSGITVRRSSHEHTSEGVSMAVWDKVDAFDSQHRQTVDKVNIELLVKASSSKHRFTADLAGTLVKYELKPQSSTHKFASAFAPIRKPDEYTGTELLYNITLPYQRKLDVDVSDRTLTVEST